MLRERRQVACGLHPVRVIEIRIAVGLRIVAVHHVREAAVIQRVDQQVRLPGRRCEHGIAHLPGCDHGSEARDGEQHVRQATSPATHAEYERHGQQRQQLQLWPHRQASPSSRPAAIQCRLRPVGSTAMTALNVAASSNAVNSDFGNQVGADRREVWTGRDQIRRWRRPMAAATVGAQSDRRARSIQRRAWPARARRGERMLRPEDSPMNKVRKAG